MRFICIRIEIIFILIASHLSSHCNRGLEQLGNGLFLQNSLKRDGSLWFASSPLTMKNDEVQKMVGNLTKKCETAES